MTKTLALALASVVALSCSHNAAKIAATEKSDSQRTEMTGSMPVPELTDERFQQLVRAIPEHTHVESPRTTLSKDYYATWKEAWEIPGGGLGDIGNEEFLFYFVCGNDPCATHSGKLKSKKVSGGSAVVKFNIVHTGDAGEMADYVHTFNLVVENGRWVIADYDSTLVRMKEYIKTQRKYLRSAEYKAEATRILNSPDTDAQYKKAVRDELEEVKRYFRKHTD